LIQWRYLLEPATERVKMQEPKGLWLRNQALRSCMCLLLKKKANTA
jgi:hypothetical protein